MDLVEVSSQGSIGGGESSRLLSSVDIYCNVNKAARASNVVAALSRGLPTLNYHLAQTDNGRIGIVGGGPSLPATFKRLRFERQRGAAVMALNGAGRWLLDRGVVPDLHFVIDAKHGCYQFFSRTHPDTHYIIASHCDPAVFDALQGRRVSLIHIYEPDMEEVYSANIVTPTGRVPLLGGGSSVAMKALFLAEYLGYTRQHLFGVDSCHLDGAHHAYSQPANDDEAAVDVSVRGRRFRCAHWHIRQADDFIHQVRDMFDRGVRVRVHGDGLLSWILSDKETASDRGQ